MNNNKLSVAEYLLIAQCDLQWNHQNKIHNSQYYFIKRTISKSDPEYSQIILV